MKYVRVTFLFIYVFLTTGVIKYTSVDEKLPLQESKWSSYREPYIVVEYIIPEFPREYRHLLYKYATLYNVPIYYVVSQIIEESGFNPFAYNMNPDGTNDKGLTQLNSSNYDYFKWKFNKGKDYDPYNPEDAIRIGVQYLRYLYDHSGSWKLALMGYNAGPNKVRSGRIPARTKQYYKNIMSRVIIYRRENNE